LAGKRFDVTCLGILVADVVIKPVTELPEPNTLLLIDACELHNGGGVSNTGNALGRLGIRTAALGRMGCDGFATFLEGVLADHDIYTGSIVRDEQLNTSSTIVMVAPDGERAFYHYIGANARFCLDDIDWDVVGASTYVHVAYPSLLPGLDGEPTVELMKKARSLGAKTSVDPVRNINLDWGAFMKPYFPHMDVFLPSYDEAVDISGLTEPSDIARSFLDQGVGFVGIKMGEEGCYLNNGRAEVSLPSFQVEPVDTTGAGDAWVAGVLTGLVKGWDLDRTARFANAMGGVVCLAMGASTGVRTMEEMESFLSDAPLRS